MEKLKVLGDRVAVTELGFALTGTIEIPNVDKFLTYRIGKVVARGNGEGLELVGKRTKAYRVEMTVEKDEAVVFAIPKHATVSTGLRLEGIGFTTFINMGDCIARLRPEPNPDNILEPRFIPDIDHFEALGNYVLLEMYEVKDTSTDLIIKPENAVSMEHTRFKVLQLGKGGEFDGKYAPGDTVAIDRLRATPLMLTCPGLEVIAQMKEYYFIHKDYVTAVLGKE